MKTPKIISKAWSLAKKTREKSYSPYSRFKVGAAIVTSSGKVYSGCNVENASYGGTICAERTAIFDAVKNGQKKIKHVVVVTDAKSPTPPCGFCRQVIAEFADNSTKIWIGNLEEIKESHNFFDLLPHAFTPKNLK